MIDVQAQVKIYEEDGKDIACGVDDPKRFIEVSSHWNRRERVVIQVDDGPSVTVLAKDLMAAVTNAQNTAKF